MSPQFKRVFRNIFLRLLIIPGVALVYFTINYEKLSPETETFLTLTEKEKEQTQTTAQFFSNLNNTTDNGYELSKNTPCRISETPTDKKTFISQWNEYLQKSKFEEKELHPYLNQKFFSMAGDDFPKVLSRINELRNIRYKLTAHSCFLKLQGKPLEAESFDLSITQIDVNSLKVPNAVLSTLILLGPIIANLEANIKNPKFAELKKSVKALMETETADALFWKSARYDAIMITQTIQTAHYHEDALDRLGYWLLPVNQFKNKIANPIIKQKLPKTDEDDKPHPYFFVSNLMNNYQALSFSRLEDSRERINLRWNELKKLTTTSTNPSKPQY